MTTIERVISKRAAKMPHHYPAGFIPPMEWLGMDQKQLAFAIYKHEGGKLE